MNKIMISAAIYESRDGLKKIANKLKIIFRIITLLFFSKNTLLLQNFCYYVLGALPLSGCRKKIDQA